MNVFMLMILGALVLIGIATACFCVFVALFADPKKSATKHQAVVVQIGWGVIAAALAVSSFLVGVILVRVIGTSC